MFYIRSHTVITSRTHNFDHIVCSYIKNFFPSHNFLQIFDECVEPIVGQKTHIAFYHSSTELNFQEKSRNNQIDNNIHLLFH